MNTSFQANYPALTQATLAAHNALHGQAEDVAEPKADPADPNLNGDFAAEGVGVDFEIMTNVSDAASLEIRNLLEETLAKLREVEAQKALESKQAAERTLQLQKELDAERARRQQADVDNARRLAEERARTLAAQQETDRVEKARQQTEIERNRLVQEAERQRLAAVQQPPDPLAAIRAMPPGAAQARAQRKARNFY